MDTSADTDERQLALARLRADELRRACEYLINQEARRVERQASDYLVSFNIETPKGCTHIEVSVRDAADGALWQV